MGTKVDCKSYFPGYYSMRDLNEDSSSSSWPPCYGDKPITNGQYFNGFMPRTIVDGYPAYDKDALKQKMLEHEAVFKNQVYELHRLYRIQRNMMEEVKRKELRLRASMEPSSSSSLRGSQLPSEDARKWHMAGFPLSNSGYDRTSISGVEIVNSPMSCTKGCNTTQLGHFPFQNGSSLKDSEPSVLRPLKVRKKLFDLQLPADEYIDTEEGEKLADCKISSYAPNSSLKSGPQSGVKLSFGGHAGVKMNSIRLADLNEPIGIEETNFLDHSSINGEAKGVNQPAKANGGYLGVNQETVHIHNGFLINSPVESKVNERARFSHVYEAGSSKSRDKLPIPSSLQGMLSSVDQPPLLYPTGHTREDMWKGMNHHGLESSDRSRVHSSNSHLEPLAASHAHGSDPFFSSCFTSSRPHSVSSWIKPTSSFTQKITTLNGFYHGSPSGCKELNSHLPSAGLDYLNSSKLATVASDRSTNHGYGYFPNTSRLVDSKPAIDLNLNEVVPKGSSDDVVVIDGRNKPEDPLSALPWLKRKPAHASDKQLCCKSEAVTDLNQPFTPNIMLASSDHEIVRKDETAETQNVKKILGFPIFETGALKNEPSTTSVSVGCAHEGNDVIKEKQTRVIDINLECEPDEQIADEELTVEKEGQTKGTSMRDLIDLNACVSDSEDPSAPSYESKTDRAKVILEIDLEAPVLLENEDDSTLPSQENVVQSLENKNDSLQDEVLRDAAETILAISSTCPKILAEDTILHTSEASLAESLLWFVDAVCANEVLESTSGNDLTVRDSSLPHDESSEEMDDFEAMTLQLKETKEEDYMPMAFVPEVQTVEETGPNTLTTRSRRGQSRRGRQRRDFQRDILPGLASLSRHEVTEDLQTFGGLMRATGHHWISGLTRRNVTRNGGVRGRRRAVVETASPTTLSPVSTPLMQQLTSIEAGLEDRSLTGWGKTTRRPRRQRCPAGNPPPVVLT